LKRGGIFIILIFLFMDFSFFADSYNDNTESTSSIEQWEQDVVEELSVKAQKAHIPLSTLRFVLSRIDKHMLPHDRTQALEKIFDLTKRYDLELRRGKSLSKVEVELKRELALSKDKKDKPKVMSAIKLKEKTDVKEVKEKKDEKIKEVKDKIKEKKEKEKIKEKIEEKLDK
jgi:hypothetical protein